MGLGNPPEPRRDRGGRAPGRWGKRLRERVMAALLLVFTAPIFVACVIAIRIEAFLDPRASGPIFFRESRISQGRTIDLLKFRTIQRSALEGLGPGPTHVKIVEQRGHLTKVGGFLKQWYLDELPQLINIIKGDMGLIGTRPWPLDMYEAHLAEGRTLKRDMPAGLIGPVQAGKGTGIDGMEVDAWYWDAYLNLPGWKLFLVDVRIIRDSIHRLLKHEGL